MKLESVQTMLSVNSIVTSAKDHVGCDLGGEEVILDIKSGLYYGLDAVGARVWRLVQEPTSLADIRDTIVSEFEVQPDQCESDLMEFLATMIENGLVEISN